MLSAKRSKYDVRLPHAKYLAVVPITSFRQFRDPHGVRMSDRDAGEGFAFFTWVSYRVKHDAGFRYHGYGWDCNICRGAWESLQLYGPNRSSRNARAVAVSVGTNIPARLR